MTRKNHEYVVDISAMRIEELVVVITNEATKKGDFDKAITLYVNGNPVKFKEELLELAEKHKEVEIVHSRILFYLQREGHVDVDLLDEDEPD